MRAFSLRKRPACRSGACGSLLRTGAGAGMMINSSRAILYASREKDFAAAARNVALQTRETINRFRQG